MYSSFQVMYTVGYSLSLGALLLALAILLGLSKLHCTRNYVHMNLFVSFVLKASSVLVIDTLLKTRYSQRIGDDLSVSVWLSDGAVAGCRVAAVFMQYGVVANYCWLLVEGLYLHSLLGLATIPERSCFPLYLGIGWGAPMLFVIPWVVVKCLFENIQCWTSNDNMGFWWILRFPVFLAILINFFIFLRILHLLVAKLRAHQMPYTDYKFRLAKSTLTLIPLLGVHEVVFAFVTDEHAQGTLRSAKLFFDLFLSSFQGLLVAVLYCFLNKERPAWLTASLDWLRTPPEAPWNSSWGWTQVPREGITRQSRTNAQQRREHGSQTAPHHPHVPPCGGLRGTCSVPRGRGWGVAGKLFCECIPMCSMCVSMSELEETCPPTIKSSVLTLGGKLGWRRGASWAQGLPVRRERLWTARAGSLPRDVPFVASSYR
ncbi:glucagon receptor isoform X2 [Hippopotamus amphibius kiboko]|uniref:glucagon receptor isoform X2 n=1 Tax=Hippopotamus amphibius kiboko TaxID=575201 RepID=UPI0025923A54|nr:glucagon receptor isoform X2 [Hippopotamus amphibius kiboko]